MLEICLASLILATIAFGVADFALSDGRVVVAAGRAVEKAAILIVSGIIAVTKTLWSVLSSLATILVPREIDMRLVVFSRRSWERIPGTTPSATPLVVWLVGSVSLFIVLTYMGLSSFCPEIHPMSTIVFLGLAILCFRKLAILGKSNDWDSARAGISLFLGAISSIVSLTAFSMWATGAVSTKELGATVLFTGICIAGVLAIGSSVFTVRLRTRHA